MQAGVEMGADGRVGGEAGVVGIANGAQVGGEYVFEASFFCGIVELERSDEGIDALVEGGIGSGGDRGRGGFQGRELGWG